MLKPERLVIENVLPASPCVPARRFHASAEAVAASELRLFRRRGFSLALLTEVEHFNGEML